MQMKNRYADAEALVRDNERVAAIRDEARTRVERKFAPIRERAERNAKKMSEARGYLAPW
jgi:hypothetical protein